MKYYVTVRSSHSGEVKYLRGGARMYTTRVSEAMVFKTRESADAVAESVQKLMDMLPPSRRWIVRVMQRSGGGR